MIFRRNIVIGILLILAVAAGIYFIWVRREKTLKLSPETTPTPSSGIEESIERKFNIQIPENVTKAELKAVSETEGSGLATEDAQNGKTELTILVNLPEPEKDKFYQAWIQRSNSFISLGQLREAKGGWIFEGESQLKKEDIEDILITLEAKYDNTPEKEILKGSF